MIATLAICLIFALALATTLTRGVAATFTAVLLPALIVFYQITPLAIEKLPDVNAVTAVSYGVLLAIVIKGQLRLDFPLHPVDLIVFAMSLTAVLGSVVNEQVWTGVSTTGFEVLEQLTPYFMARAAFLDRAWRVRSAKVIAGLAVPLALFALVEMRLFPNMFARTIMKPFGLTNADWQLVLQRFGLFRAQVSFTHPIDLGNGGILLGCLLATLACSAGYLFYRGWVAVGLACCLIMSLCSMSFTSFVAVAAIIGLFSLMRLTKLGGWLLVPTFLAVAVGYTALTYSFVNTPLQDLKYDEIGQYEGSYHTRHLIVQNVWNYATERGGGFGWLGHGRTVSNRDLGLESVDNAYLLFLLRQGWVYLFLLLLLGVTICLTASKRLARIDDPEARVPLAAGVAGIVGTMMGMYTVFFGFVYAKLFILLLGGVVTLSVMAESRLSGRGPSRGETDDGVPLDRPGGAFGR